MKIVILFCIVAAATLCEGQGSNYLRSNTASKKGYYRTAYDTVKRGVQIVAIEADEHNDLHDEWIVLQTDTPRSLKGWYLSAGNKGQTYMLYSRIEDSLVIYTHADKDLIGARDTGLFLAAKKFIWNNTKQDNGLLFNDHGQIVDVFSFGN